MGGPRLLFRLAVCLILLSFKEDDSSVRILFTGDILLSRNVDMEIQRRHSNPWTEIGSFFQSADLVVGNLEGAAGNNEMLLNPKVSSPVFPIDSSYLPLLGNAGYKMITLENNHSLDLGKEGKIRTARLLQQNEITPVYYQNSPQFYTIKDVTIGLVALNIVPCRDSSKNILPSVEIQQKLRLAKSLANIVIVSIHWGSELLDWPNQQQREIAQWLIKNGADLIIGSHPHVIQKPELVEGKPVFFSLGNHLFDQKYPKSKEGLIAEIIITKSEVQCKGYLTHTLPDSFYPAITREVNLGLPPLKLVRTDFRINGFVFKPLSLPDTSLNKIILKAYKQNRFLWQTHPIPVVSVSGAKFDEDGNNLFFLEKHYSKLDREVMIRPYVYRFDEHGIYALWRGSALAWPIQDARISPYDSKTLVVLHRGDSYINLNPGNKSKHLALYKWNGFGFTGINDSLNLKSYKELFPEF